MNTRQKPDWELRLEGAEAFAEVYGDNDLRERIAKALTQPMTEGWANHAPELWHRIAAIIELDQPMTERKNDQVGDTEAPESPRANDMSGETEAPAPVIRSIWVSCPTCLGSGEVEGEWNHGEDGERFTTGCPDCIAIGQFPVSPEEWRQAWSLLEDDKDPEQRVLDAAMFIAWKELEPRQREIYLDYARRTM